MLVSIIITSYNCQDYIEACLLSCLSQIDFNSFEIIVVDDGSTDNSYCIFEKYNGGIKLFRNKNVGIEAASNFGIKQSMAKYVVRVDADDILEPNYLVTAVNSIEKCKIAFVYSDYAIINSSGDICSHMKLPAFDKNEIIHRGDFLATGTLYNKAALENIGLYNESVKNSGLENFELILKLLENRYVGYHLKNELFRYRRHQKNLSNVKRDNIIAYGKKLFANYNLGNYCTNEYHPYGLVINE